MKQVKYLLGGKRVQYMWIDKQAEGECLSCTHMAFKITYMRHFFWVWQIITIYLVHFPDLVYFRILPFVCTHLLAKMDPTEKSAG